MICPAKHTKYNPTLEEWACPNCGEREDFYIEDVDQEAMEGCEKLHCRDNIVCVNCGKGWTGTQLANIYIRKQNLISCPRCGGRGMVRKEG